MRKPFKSFLRHGPISKRQIVEGPNDPEIVDVTILPQWDTVLRYDGSPLMVDGTVNDPGEDKPVVPGDNVSYKDFDENNTIQRDWIAIGLATDNLPDDKFRSPNPFDPDAAGDDISDGVVYTNTGPTRSVLSFDLEDIPAEAEILSAVLELVPVEDKSNYDAWDEFDVTNIVWPGGGVPCEILNLVEETQETCTWNTLNNQNLNGYPVQSTRWHRQTNSEQLPNPIGAMQNSKRWDVTEGTESFSSPSRYIGSVPIADIDIDGTEIYGHVGYGAMGGGAVENVPENKNELNQFDISFAAHDAQNDPNVNTVVVQDIDVIRAVKYAHAEQNRTCNLLLRATHWTPTDLTEDQTEIIEEVFTPPDLELNSITLEDESDSNTDVESDHNAIVRFNPPTFDFDGNPATVDDISWVDKASDEGWQVTYDWQVKYPPIEDITFEVFRNEENIGDQTGVPTLQNFVVGDIISVRNISSIGGFENLDRYEIYLGEDGETGSRSSGINFPLTLLATDFPNSATSVEIKCLVNVQAQGANVALNGEEEGDSSSGFFPEKTIQPELSLGIITGVDPDEQDTPSQFNVTYSPVGTEDNDFGSPIEDMNVPITVHVTLTVTDFRPGFNWTNFELPVLSVSLIKFLTIRKINDSGNIFVPTIVNDTFRIDDNVATNEFDITFTAQDIIDSKPAFSRGDSFELLAGLNYQVIGTDQGEVYIDTFDGDAASERYEFTIAQASTPNNFDITDPNNRRGVFDTIGLQTFSDSQDAAINAVTGTLANSPESSVKAVLRQVELAPCQLKCDSTESFTTVLMPIEELSRFNGNQSENGWPENAQSFAGIRGTKNKFAVCSGGLQRTNDESGIRNSDGSLLVAPGNLAARTDLITSGGIGARIERQAPVDGALTDISVPSDLAVYYYNKSPQVGQQCSPSDCTSVRDNTGEDCNADGCPTVADVGWVYYRAHSKKARIANSATNPGRFRENDDLYDASDFNVPNTDDGLEFVQWEKLAGDPLGLLDTAGGFDGTNPNIGAYIFLLNDRYDNVASLTNAELSNKQKWPVPFSSAFSLNVITPDASTLATEIRNNPTLFDLFEQEGSVGDIVDIIDYRLKSLDNGTEGNDPIVFNTAGFVGPDPDSDVDNDGNFTANPPQFTGPSTRDADGKLTALSTSESLYISGPNTNNTDDSGVDVYEVTPYAPLDNTQRLDILFEGAEFDFTNLGVDGEYCNYKSHFWNGKGSDLVRESVIDPFQTSVSTQGSIPLIWRRADDAYFSHIVNSVGTNATSPLPEPITDSISTESPLAYHGINLQHSKLHEKLRNAAANTNDPSAVPFVQYIVEVIRGGCVYHRDIYRLSGVQDTDPNKRTRADGDCPSCLAPVVDGVVCCEDGNDVNCGSALAQGQDGLMADTLYQFGVDGVAWRDDTEAETSWYAPSDWRAGDTVRIYAIVPHTADDTVVDDDGNPITVNPTPTIARIKKYCPVGDPVVPGIPGCCPDVDRLIECPDCIIVCHIPPLDGGDISIGTGTGFGGNQGGGNAGGGNAGGGNAGGGGQAGGGGSSFGGF